MKMTDVEYLADKYETRARNWGRLSDPSAQGHAKQAEDAAADFRALAARLAADQQKGGVDIECSDMGAYTDYSFPQQKGGGGFVRSDGATQCADCGGWNLPDCPPCCDTPQPSIPAPAQQDGKASGGEYLFTSEEVDEALELLRFHRSSIVTEAIDHMEACLRANVDDALAHPPHADQETQG